MITKTIIVTQEDISNGERACNDGCPIALAMQRIWPDAHVGTEHFWPWATEFPDMPVTGDLPDVAKDFVRDYDDGNHVEPFSFTASYEEDPHARQS